MFTRTIPRAAAAVLAAVLTLAACGGDDGPTGPSPDFDIAGQWQWQVTNASEGNSKCTVTDVTITFSEQNGVLTGHRFSPGDDNFICSFFGGPPLIRSYDTNDDLDDLVLSGTDISFSFATTTGEWEMSGRITSDNTMSGSATIRISTTIGPMTLTGPWTATR